MSEVKGQKITTGTINPACQNLQDSSDHFCAFHPNDCEEPYAWVSPEDTRSVIGTSCTCEKVRTGGCVGGFTSFICGLTPDDCIYSTFFAPASLKREHGESCRLCPESDITVTAALDGIDMIEKDILYSFGIPAAISLAVAILLGCAIRCCFVKRRNKRLAMKGNVDAITGDLDAIDLQDRKEESETKGDPKLKQIV
mmetsp:Transcript_228/g.338  ORF Transcript_228/g.338 Transcript_228/m.338 type:complete len:197 (+) Transcript_228:784-1374(+)